MVTFASTVQKVGDPLAFYSVATTVIPVLYLAVIFQARFFQQRRDLSDVPFLSGYVQVLVVVAFAGETNALRALVSQHPTEWSQHATSVALLVLGVVLLSEPFLALGEPVDGVLAKAGLPAWLSWVRFSRVIATVFALGTLAGILEILGTFNP